MTLTCVWPPHKHRMVCIRYINLIHECVCAKLNSRKLFGNSFHRDIQHRKIRCLEKWVNSEKDLKERQWLWHVRTGAGSRADVWDMSASSRENSTEKGKCFCGVKKIWHTTGAGTLVVFPQPGENSARHGVWEDTRREKEGATSSCNSSRWGRLCLLKILSTSQGGLMHPSC